MAAPLRAPTDLSELSAWEVAQSYHELKKSGLSEEALRKLKEVSVEAIIRQAKDVMGSVPQPLDPQLAALPNVPAHAISPEVDLEETLEASPEWVSGRVSPTDIQISFQSPRVRTLVIAVDTSLSMNGHKLALTAVALAVVLLQFPQHRIGIVAFENVARMIQEPSEPLSFKRTIERFLDVPGQGYTDLEAGLKAALQSVDAGREGRTATLLLTDGKYTAGRDPSYLAPRFHPLWVIKLGKDRASLDFCQRLATSGGGELREVGELEDLPGMMYSVVKGLFRG